MQNKIDDMGISKLKILCFGDSNTYGLIPGTDERYDRMTRWPGRLEWLLGNGCQVMEEGLCGRTCASRDIIYPERYGLDGLKKILKHCELLDILIIMLGTNDCKVRCKMTPGEIAFGLERILKYAKSHVSKGFWIFIVSPVLLGNGVEQYDPAFDEDSVKCSKELAVLYEKIANHQNCGFLDAAMVTAASDVDNVHMNAYSHELLAEAVSEKIRQYLDDLF